MSQTIISKLCSHCKQVKPIAHFHKNRSNLDGFAYQCNICKNKSNKRYSQTNKNKIAQKRYQQGTKFKATQKRYQQSEKGKTTRRNAIYLYRKRHPERAKARTAVRNAIQSGQLPPINTQKCKCKEQAVEYHHWSYLPEHWLDVEPICRECHNKHLLLYHQRAARRTV